VSRTLLKVGDFVRVRGDVDIAPALAGSIGKVVRIKSNAVFLPFVVRFRSNELLCGADELIHVSTPQDLTIRLIRKEPVCRHIPSKSK